MASWERHSRRIRDMSHSASPAGFSGRARVIVTGVFGGFLVLGVVLGRTQPWQLPVPVTAGAACGAAAAALALSSRVWPVLAALALAALSTTGIAVVGDTRAGNLVWFDVVLLAGWIALVYGRVAGVAYWAAVTTLFAVEWTTVQYDPGWGSWLGGSAAGLVFGLLVRHLIGLVEQLRAAQAELAASARMEERNRIARDLHDVIAHTLTVSLLHVMSARLAVEHEPPAVAVQSLGEAERLCRDSLTEVRQVVGMLRADGDLDGRTSPLPGVDGLGPLVTQFQAAGASVSFAAEGDTGRVPATVGLALHRILQEALTNVIKHAAGSMAFVRLVVADGSVTLTVDSTGAPARAANGGHGVIGMRERAESLGGTCTAGPAGRGWLVGATFPLGGLS
jgi:signal transduction histidine kinase